MDMPASTLDINVGDVPRITEPPEMEKVTLRGVELKDNQVHGENLYLILKNLTDGSYQRKEILV